MFKLIEIIGLSKSQEQKDHDYRMELNMEYSQLREDLNEIYFKRASLESEYIINAHITILERIVILDEKIPHIKDRMMSINKELEIIDND